MTPEEVKKEVKREIAEAMVNNLPAGVGEIIIREGEAVERAVRAKPLAKRHVHVEHVALPRRRRGHAKLGGRLEFQVVLRALAHDRREHTFRQHGYLSI